MGETSGYSDYSGPTEEALKKLEGHLAMACSDSAADLLCRVRAEITSLRADLDEARNGVRNGIPTRWVTALQKEIAGLRAELAAERTAFVAQQQVSQTFAEGLGKIAAFTQALVADMHVGRRQDAEEKARLKEALILARKEISDHDSDYHHRTRESTIEAIRDALACHPKEKDNG